MQFLFRVLVLVIISRSNLELSLQPRPAKSGSKVGDKKALYAQLRAGNEYNRLKANIGRLRMEEEELKTKNKVTGSRLYGGF